MKTFNKRDYQRDYYLKNKDKIRRKSQDYYYFNRYGLTYEQILLEKEKLKPFFSIVKGYFLITFE